jgi:hypothetical protein
MQQRNCKQEINKSKQQLRELTEGLKGKKVDNGAVNYQLQGHFALQKLR